MADRIPDAPQARRATFPHEWHSYNDYLDVHDQYMQALTDEGLVLYNHLVFNEVMSRDRRPELIILEGDIECANDVTISVRKMLEVRRNSRRQLEVKGSVYSYHAFKRIKNGAERPVLRIDNSHGIPKLHRHHFHPISGEETQFPITIDDLPSLADFIREACERAFLQTASETESV